MIQSLTNNKTGSRLQLQLDQIAPFNGRNDNQNGYNSERVSGRKSLDGSLRESQNIKKKVKIIEEENPIDKDFMASLNKSSGRFQGDVENGRFGTIMTTINDEKSNIPLNEISGLIDMGLPRNSVRELQTFKDNQA